MNKTAALLNKRRVVAGFPLARTGQWHDCNTTVNIVDDIRLDD